jgi:hypothetical protein
VFHEVENVPGGNNRRQFFEQPLGRRISSGGIMIRVISRFTWGLIVIASLSPLAVHAEAPPKQESASGITHGFLALGNETYIIDESGKVTWRYPRGTRDGWVLPGGNVLLAVNKDREYPGGAAIEITRDGKVG